MRPSLLSSTIIFAAAAILAVSAFISPLHAFTRGAILSPTRVVMEGRDRSPAVKIINPDDATNRYKISLINMRMDEYGRRTEVKAPTPEEKKVVDMIRFSPRRATLGPKEWQTVRLMVRKPSDLAPGEYRAHLRVAPTPPDQIPDAESGGGTPQMKISLNVVFAITIPVIVRHGEGGVKIIPEDPVIKQMEDNRSFLETRLAREGIHSAYFDLRAFRVRPGGEREKIGELPGVSVYAPNTLITMDIPLLQDKISGLAGSPVVLEIQDREERTRPVTGSWDFVLDK